MHDGISVDVDIVEEIEDLVGFILLLVRGLQRDLLDEIDTRRTHHARAFHGVNALDPIVRGDDRDGGFPLSEIAGGEPSLGGHPLVVRRSF